MLLFYYQNGLKRPLKFFPKTSYGFADLVLNKKKEEKEALKKTDAVFAGNDFSMGEFDNLYCQFCFKHAEPRDDEFQKIAIDIYQPMMNSIKGPKR